MTAKLFTTKQTTLIGALNHNYFSFRIRPHNLWTKSWKFWQQCLLSWFSMKMPCHCGKSFEYKIDLLSWGAIKRATTGLPFLYCGSVAYSREGGKFKNLGGQNRFSVLVFVFVAILAQLYLVGPETYKTFLKNQISFFKSNVSFS